MTPPNEERVLFLNVLFETYTADTDAKVTTPPNALAELLWKLVQPIDPAEEENPITPENDETRLFEKLLRVISIPLVLLNSITPPKEEAKLLLKLDLSIVTL